MTQLEVFNAGMGERLQYLLLGWPSLKRLHLRGERCCVLRVAEMVTSSRQGWGPFMHRNTTDDGRMSMTGNVTARDHEACVYGGVRFATLCTSAKQNPTFNVLSLSHSNVESSLNSFVKHSLFLKIYCPYEEQPPK